MANIAYIDDNRDCLTVIKLAFEEIGMDIEIYDDPIQFYNQDKEYQLIISDYDMPQMNGQEFIGLLKKKYPKTKTIIYSGVVQEIQDKDVQIDTFLLKPLEFESLLKAVKYLLFAYEKENLKEA